MYAVDFGILKITWYAVAIVTGMIIGGSLFIKSALKFGFDEDVITDYIFYTVIWGMLGARTWYVLFNLDYYLANPLQIPAIQNGGLAIHGGLIGGLLYTMYYCKKNKINIFLLGDLAAPSLLIAQSIGRWGNFVNQEAYGTATTYEFLAETLRLPAFIVNGMNIDGVYYNPTFLYESIWNFIGFFIALYLVKKIDVKNGGIVLSFYLIWYGVIRTWIESLRLDALMMGPIKVAQLTSIIMVISGIIILVKIYVKKREVKNV